MPDSTALNTEELLDDERIKMLSTRLTNKLSRDQVTVAWLGALIPVSVFIAGVQAQILSFTISLAQPGKEAIVVAANWFGFNGLMLDLIGCVLASLRVISLEHYARAMQSNIGVMHSSHSALRTLLGSVDNSSLTTEHHKMLSEHKQIIADVESMCRFRLAHRERGVDASDPRETVQEAINGPFNGMSTRDQLTLFAIYLGVTFLLLSVLLLAVATQLRRVWVGCIVFLVAGYGYTMLSLLLFGDPDPDIRRSLSQIWRNCVEIALRPT
ncbi:hypothetical protein AB1N83_009544 [Pleurotus pulmonarius]